VTAGAVVSHPGGSGAQMVLSCSFSATSSPRVQGGHSICVTQVGGTHGKAPHAAQSSPQAAATAHSSCDSSSTACEVSSMHQHLAGGALLGAGACTAAAAAAAAALGWVHPWWGLGNPSCPLASNFW
jgi:hypothetical protein